MKIVSREQSTLAVTSYLNIIITSSVSSTINNLQLNLAFEAQNGNITLIDHVTGTLNISGYQVLGVIQSLQIVAMIGINVEQAVLNLQNINYNPTVHNAGNLSSYLISNTYISKILINDIFMVSQVQIIFENLFWNPILESNYENQQRKLFYETVSTY
ncbi:Hypothetical_protein [Hexamita inflata]|uniref:Hypothetical_protein n=1 Tax=Hexamita inflata TaxID=28002 RepID=A0AA86R123_9EUKA|nr:Hypothetical protein HINF_LOCUS54777 [Hexamita inflata]